MPVYPQPWPGASPYSCGGWHGPRSRMSTTRRSPGWAPSISIGPLSMCATVRSTSHVVGGVVVSELGVRPLPALHAELAARLHRVGGRNVGMPAIVTRHRLIAHGLRLIDAEDDLRHVRSSRGLEAAGDTAAGSGLCPARRQGQGDARGSVHGALGSGLAAGPIG